MRARSRNGGRTIDLTFDKPGEGLSFVQKFAEASREREAKCDAAQAAAAQLPQYPGVFELPIKDPTKIARNQAIYDSVVSVLWLAEGVEAPVPRETKFILVGCRAPEGEVREKITAGGAEKVERYKDFAPRYRLEPGQVKVVLSKAANAP